MKNGIAKLTGFARPDSLSKDLPVKIVRHIAPENLEGKCFTPSSDIYSLAIILWELWYGCCVFEKLEDAEMRKKVKAGERPIIDKNSVPDIKLIIENCWSQNPSQRRTASEVQGDLKDIYTALYETDIAATERIKYVDKNTKTTS